MSYENFIAFRYLMAERRSRVVSIITLISVAGVALGVTAMIVVLSVMGGFKKDLKDKILGTKAHVVVQAEDGGELQETDKVLDEARSIDDVVGASPFVDAEVMASSPTNLNGVMLRGINPETIGEVSDLDTSMQAEKAEGKLEYLSDPQPLLDKLEEEREEANRSLQEEIEAARKEFEKEQERAESGDSIDDDQMPSLKGTEESGGGAEVTPEDLELDSDGEEGGMPPIEESDESESAEAPGKDEEGEAEMPPISGESEETSGDGGENDSGMPPIAGPSDEGGSGGDKQDDNTEESSTQMPSVSGEQEAGDEADTELPGILVGKELAKTLQVDLGSEINVVTPQGEMGPTGPIPKTRPFRVVGVFYTGMYEYDANHAYTTLDDARDFLDLEGVSGVELKTDDVNNAFAVANTLEERLPDSIEARDWKEMNRSLFYALKLEKIAMFVVLTFIILVASFSIIAMLIMIVLEKKRAIAVLKSMGMRDGGVMKIFIYQGVAIGAVGAAIGLILGLTICFLLAEFGFPLNSEVYYISTLPVEIKRLEIFLVVACTILISFLATIYPSRKASRLSPVEGLRYE
jgi:lipoprotein-releasing system permease protein